MEKSYPGLFAKLFSKFDDAKSYRESLDSNGETIIIPWEEALKRFYISNQYKGVTNDNLDIAQLFGSKWLPQDLFDAANELREIFKKRNITEHILGKPLREDTILESIEKIKNQTEQELKSSKELIEELYDKQFTYEWLNKNDPHNAIMGLFCSCCGSISSPYYGKEIAKASIIAPDVQNLVVRNSKGEIISKGTMYINKYKGYGIINDFEINRIYKKHEYSAGRYSVDEISTDEQEREMIFKAFQRGIMAFVEEYDKQNPDKPINQINIGMDHNRLKKQVERFKKATSNLNVPFEYNFLDALSEDQYVLYKKDEKQIEDGGLEI